MIGLYNDVNILLHFIYNNIKLLINNNISFIDIIKKYKIDVYRDIIYENRYIIDINNFKFKDNNNYHLFTNNINIINIYNDIIKHNNDCNHYINNNDNKLELNMFLNIDNNEIKQKYDEIRQKYEDEKLNIEKMKLKLKREHEKSEELKRKFIVNKDLYFQFKKELENNNLFEIPELFKKEFIIFTNLENNNILNNNNEIIEYINQINNDKEDTIYNDLFNENSDDSINSDNSN